MLSTHCLYSLTCANECLTLDSVGNMWVNNLCEVVVATWLNVYEKSSLCCNEKGRQGAIIELFELSNELDAPLRLHIRNNILLPNNNISTSILFDSIIPRRSTRIGEISQYDKNKFRTPPETLGKATRKKTRKKTAWRLLLDSFIDSYQSFRELIVNYVPPTVDTWLLPCQQVVWRSNVHESLLWETIPNCRQWKETFNYITRKQQWKNKKAIPTNWWKRANMTIPNTPPKTPGKAVTKTTTVVKG